MELPLEARRSLCSELLGRLVEKIHPVRSREAWSSGASRPLGVKAGAIIEGFLRSHARRRQAGIEVRAANGFLFGHAFTKKHGETADESIAGAGAVHTFHRERGNVFTAVAAGEKRSTRS